MTSVPIQQSFFDIFAEAAFEQETAHLPAGYDEAIPYFRQLIERTDAAIRAGDFKTAQKISDEAHDLALKLNGGNPGILANADSPGYVLERECAATAGEVPLWGQEGEFIIEPRPGLRVRVEMEGIFGLAAMPIPGFCVHAVDYDRPFLSETGYRNFLGYHVAPEPGDTPDAFAAAIINHYIDRYMKGRLLRIEDRYRQMHENQPREEAPTP